MLKVHTGNKLENLLATMEQNIRAHTPDPLAKVPVCIQTAGMQRWVGLEMAKHAGISANLDFVFPGALMKRLAGVKAGESTPWPEKQELIWGVFEKLQNLPSTPVYEHINTYLSNDTDRVKTYRLAGRIADTFDQYQVYRPQMVMDWLSPRPSEIPDSASDKWQPELFRSLFTAKPCKTQVFDRFIKSHSKKNKKTQMHPIHIFGISVMPIFFIEMLKAASLHTDVFFYLLSPTRRYWGDSKTVREIRRNEAWTGKTAEELYISENHELLDNLGVMGRDFFDYIYGSDDMFEPDERYFDIESTSVLSTIQANILDLSPDRADIPDDSSITVNCCHNPLREVEALYDNLLELFEKDSSLTPSDILVMTPDIEQYSPYIKAVFDNPYSGREQIPYSVADIGEKHSNRPAGVLLELIDTIRGDFSLAEVDRLLSYQIVADTFGINPTDLGTLADVLKRAGAFWAYGQEHLHRIGLEIDSTFTWQKGLRRIALGLAEGETGAIYADASFKDAPFSMSEQIGGLMRFTELAENYAKELEAEKTVQEWCELLGSMADDFLKHTYENADDMLYLSKCIANLQKEAAQGGCISRVPFKPVLERLDETLSETRGAKGFISGRLTFCAMLPMRSIPFRVICIIGLNENTFPRQKSSLEFDLIAKHPKPGDRNNRDSDRYLFLETLISAKDRLILSYTGQSERDNSKLPPSTLITELCSHLENKFDIDNKVTYHKLHSFSRDYFRADRLYTYSGSRYAAAVAFTGEKSPVTLAQETLSTDPPTEVSLAEFERFFVSPPEFFLRRMLDVYTSISEETLPETEVMELDGLLRYNATDAGVKEMLAGRRAEETLEYLFQTAQLPPQNLGRHHMAEALEKSSEIYRKASELLGAAPSEVQIDTEVNGLEIKGTIGGVAGSSHVYIKPSSIKAKDLIRCWVRHLFLNMQSPYTTYIIGDEKELTLTPADAAVLSGLTEVFLNGCREPLRFHITDGLKMMDVKAVKYDEYDNAGTSYPHRVCFGSEYTPDIGTAQKIINPLKEHMEKSK